jgi:xanthine dehydrogenase accessory factor
MTARSSESMDSIFAALAEAERKGNAVALATVVRVTGSVPRHEGAKMLIYPDGSTLGTVGGGEMESRVCAEAQSALAERTPRSVHYQLSDPSDGDPGVCGGSAEIFIEPIRPAVTLLVVGAGHVGKAVVQLGKQLGFFVVASDDRTELCTPQELPGADLYLACAMRDIPARIDLDAQTYIVLATRNVDVDVEGLPALLAEPSAYVGVIGSRRRWLTTAEALARRGIPGEAIARVRSPVGLELRAETPEEIAVSILAEVIMVRRGGTGESMGVPGR